MNLVKEGSKDILNFSFQSEVAIKVSQKIIMLFQESFLFIVYFHILSCFYAFIFNFVYTV